MSTERVPASSPATSWSPVLLAIGAGFLAAFQVGKVHIALPSIRHSFALSLVSASWLLSALSVVGLFVATPTGSYAGKIGTKKTLILGLLLVAAASAAGALSPTSAWLLGTGC
jgi:MFS family permease